MDAAEEYKVKGILKDPRRSAFRKYRDIYYGDRSLGYVIWAEFLITCFSWIPGIVGLAARAVLYPSLFRRCGRGVAFGRSITLRHAHKITLGNGVVLDDHCVVDAKGESNQGITIEDHVYIGRHSIVYCKNGDILIERQVNISSNCQVFSSNRVTLGRQTVIGAFTYILSGGEYNCRDTTRTFAEQSGMETKGPLSIGPNCWLGAHVVVADAASIGEHCVIGAGAVVVEPIPANSIAVGVPAKVVRSLEPGP
jgi:acetyltransferase-like isoleucine patch superfamily enzyme